MSEPTLRPDYETATADSRQRRWSAAAASAAIRSGRVLALLPLLPNGCLAATPAGTTMRPMGPWAMIFLCALLGLLVPTPLGVLSLALGWHSRTSRRKAYVALLFATLATVGGIALFVAVVHWRHITLEE